MEEFRQKVIKTLPTFILNDQLPIMPQEFIDASPRSRDSNRSNRENEFKDNHSSDLENNFTTMLSEVNSTVFSSI